MTALPRPEPTAAEPPAPEPPAAEPPPVVAVPPRPHLYRSRTNRVLGGVCGGLAEYSGVEALIWRVGFIALALIGAGILVYPLLWILVPAGPDTPATGLRNTLQNGRPPAA